MTCLIIKMSVGRFSVCLSSLQPDPTFATSCSTSRVCSLEIQQLFLWLMFEVFSFKVSSIGRAMRRIKRPTGVVTSQHIFSRLDLARGRRFIAFILVICIYVLVLTLSCFCCCCCCPRSIRNHGQGSDCKFP